MLYVAFTRLSCLDLEYFRHCRWWRWKCWVWRRETFFSRRYRLVNFFCRPWQWWPSFCSRGENFFFRRLFNWWHWMKLQRREHLITYYLKCGYGAFNNYLTRGEGSLYFYDAALCKTWEIGSFSVMVTFIIWNSVGSFFPLFFSDVFETFFALIKTTLS